MESENKQRENAGSGFAGGEVKTAVVAIVGRPSAGKSTFLNTVTGQPVSIVSAVPQTTRNAIRGIVNREAGQLVFIDTPGVHESSRKINLRMRSVVSSSLADADCILYVIDSTKRQAEEERQICALLKPHLKKVVAAINKIDAKEENAAEARIFLSEELPEIAAERVLEVSAKEGTGTEDVLDALFALAPSAEKLYPDEFYTDQEVDFRIAEVIREQAINRLEKEVPHCIYVKIVDLEQVTQSRMFARAFLCVEKDSQKGILIGKGAQMIKTIRIESEKALRKIFDYKIELDLQVKVDKNWRKNNQRLDRIFNPR